jgi:aminopeptidase
MGYKNSYRGNVAKTSKKKWEAMGFNDSVVHTDIVATSNRKVTAILGNGKEVVIYNNGKFVI